MSQSADAASPATTPSIDLRSLVAHSHVIDAASTVEAVQGAFAKLDVDFLAVTTGTQLVGVCARRELIGSLGSRFGFALNAKRPIREFLMAAPLIVGIDTAMTDLFKSTASRGQREFYDDVVLVGPDRRVVGLIPMHTLVRLQTEFLLRNLEQVEAARVELAGKNREMEDDLRMAREVQFALLPQGRAGFSFADRTVEFAHVYRPSGGMSGDFFDTFPVSDNAVGLLVCDVMGHGVRSALITAMIRAMLEQFHALAADPAAFLTRLNHDLTKMLRRAGGLIFVTAAYVVIDLESRRLRYAQAGHPTPFHWHASTPELRTIPCTDIEAGPALGLLDDFSYVTVETPIAPGDRVLLFTDGISEAASANGDEFGDTQMAAALTRHAATPLAAWVEALVTDASTFAGAPFGDDVCLVAAEFRA